VRTPIVVIRESGLTIIELQLELVDAAQSVGNVLGTSDAVNKYLCLQTRLAKTTRSHKAEIV